MQHFRTPLAISKSLFNVEHQSPILCVGSCFAKNIGTLLQQYKFPCLLNPYGILYNPVSIQQSLDHLLTGRVYTKADLVLNQGIWYSFDHHGLFSHPDPQHLLAQINDSLQKASSFLKKAKVLIVTLGTAQVFVQKSTGRVVANCHNTGCSPLNGLASEHYTFAPIP